MNNITAISNPTITEIVEPGRQAEGNNSLVSSATIVHNVAATPATERYGSESMTRTNLAEAEVTSLVTKLEDSTPNEGSKLLSVCDMKTATLILEKMHQKSLSELSDSDDEPIDMDDFDFDKMEGSLVAKTNASQILEEMEPCTAKYILSKMSNKDRDEIIENMQPHNKSRHTDSKREGTTLDDIREILNHRLALHITPEENIESILRSGLDPNYGGRNGMSEGTNFQQSCKNKIHFIVDSFSSLDESEFIKTNVRGNLENPTELNIGLRDTLKYQPDPSYIQKGAFYTEERIEPEEIIPMPLKNAFREPGNIGADYTPDGFVDAVSPKSTKSIIEKTEDIRKALWDKNESIYPASSDSSYTKTTE
ncbi:hypothetical protein [Vibrio sp.]|uniref:hypothetical protein n=1 Tax=Vibrio sp. TaxID=678 RepID=UPI00311FCD05